NDSHFRNHQRFTDKRPGCGARHRVHRVYRWRSDRFGPQMMKTFWEQIEGQVIDGFPLQRYLGGDENHAVFLTEYDGEEPRKAAIKLLKTNPESSESQLRRWRLASQLAHPNLARIYDRGAWQFEQVPLLYVVMEHADENLSQVIPERPLTVEE